MSGIETGKNRETQGSDATTIHIRVPIIGRDGKPVSPCTKSGGKNPNYFRLLNVMAEKTEASMLVRTPHAVQLLLALFVDKRWNWTSVLLNLQPDLS